MLDIVKTLQLDTGSVWTAQAETDDTMWTKTQTKHKAGGKGVNLLFLLLSVQYGQTDVVGVLPANSKPGHWRHIWIFPAAASTRFFVELTF